MSYYKPTEDKNDACADFAFWSFRFGLAFWGFLITGFIGLFMGQIRMSLIAFAASYFWFLAGAILTHKHLRWHYKNDDKDGHELR